MRAELRGLDLPGQGRSWPGRGGNTGCSLLVTRAYKWHPPASGNAIRIWMLYVIELKRAPLALGSTGFEDWICRPELGMGMR
jgi:hypothetical protein